MSLLEKVRALASSPEEASFYEQVFTLTSWGFTQREIYNTLAKEYECTVREVEEVTRRIREAVGEIELDQLVDKELASYLSKSIVLEQEMNEIYLRSKNNWQAQSEGRYYDEEGRRTEPVSARDLVKHLQAIEQLRRARLAVLSEMKARRYTTSPTAAQALPQADTPALEEFSRKPQLEVLDTEFVVVGKEN